jgi:hypothetical protein
MMIEREEGKKRSRRFETAGAVNLDKKRVYDDEEDKQAQATFHSSSLLHYKTLLLSSFI